METHWSTALADTILTRYPDPDSIPYKPWCYVQGYVLIGFEKLWLKTRDPRYFAYLQRFGDQHVAEDGAIRGFTGESMDDMMAGAVIVALYEHTRQAKYRLAAGRIYTAFQDYPRNSDGSFWHGKALPHEFWIDGVFMGGMFLARYGAAMGEPETCFAEVARQVASLADHCRKGDTGLFRHAWDEARAAAWADPVTGLSPEVWSEGLGWYALVLVECLERMPLDHPDRPRVAAILVELVEGLRRAQDPASGLWYQVVDKGDPPDNGHDTSGSAMFVYAIRRAADLGFVSAERYAPVAENGYLGITANARIDARGLVNIYEACDGVCVQASYADYINYPRVINAKEAVGGFLWAATAVEQPGSGAG